MIRILILCLFTLISFPSLEAKDKLKTQISTFNDSVKKAGTLDYKNNCASVNTNTKYSREKSTVYSKLNKKNIELSVLSEKEAMETFNKLKADEDNSFTFPLDGCYARAHMMASKMDNMGIISGKAFVEGDLFVDTKLGEANWSYHVASLVLVKVNGKMVPTVFDPGMFDKPVSFEIWKKKLLADKRAKLQSEYFTSRFNYGPDSRYDDMEDYVKDQVEDMKDTNRKNKIMAEVMEQMYR